MYNTHVNRGRNFQNEAAIRFTGINDPNVWHLLRLLSDNGPCYASKALGQYLEAKGITHTRGKPYHVHLRKNGVESLRFLVEKRAVILVYLM